MLSKRARALIQIAVLNNHRRYIGRSCRRSQAFTDLAKLLLDTSSFYLNLSLSRDFFLDKKGVHGWLKACTILMA